MGNLRQLSAYDAQILLEWCCWYCFEQLEPNDENFSTLELMKTTGELKEGMHAACAFLKN